MRPRPRPLLLDTDPGLDDALALAALCAEPAVELRAAIAVGGNMSSARTFRNLRAVLGLLGKRDVPVARGQQARRAFPAGGVHGSDGLAGLAGRLYARFGASAGAYAPDWRRLLRETLRVLPDHSVDLLALGPLTDLAALAEAEPRLLARKLRTAVLMAGSILDAGNTAPMVEFNVACDPRAAARVLASGWPLRLVPLDGMQDVTFGAELSRRLAARGETGRVLARFLDRLRAFREPAAQRVPSNPRSAIRSPQPARAFLHDAVAACALVRPEYFRWERLPLKVVTRGAARGVVLSDRRLRPFAPPADWPVVEVAMRADARRVYGWIATHLERASVLGLARPRSASRRDASDLS